MQLQKLLSLILICCFILPTPIARSQEGGAQGTGTSSSGLGANPAMGEGFGATGAESSAAPGSTAVGGTSTSGTRNLPTDLTQQAQFYLQRITPGIQPGEPGPPLTRPTPPPTQPPAPETGRRQGEGEQPTLLPPEPPTELELLAKSMGITLTVFGSELFRQPPQTFQPVTNVPVGPDYVVGPGDTVNIVLWGAVQAEYSLPVDRNGQIAVPKVGVVHVSGLNFRQLREVLDREFARQYTNFQMNVTLANLRTITVYVVGQARFPGSYSISSLSTLVNALFASGGPSKYGSMRNIEVRRGKNTVVRFDMYDFLLRGDKSKDIRLLPEDVIFIPVAGERVGLAGPVKVPAIYELRQEQTLSQLLAMAGGLTPSAFKNRVQITRIKNRQQIILVEDDLELFLSGRRPDIILAAGDLVRIFPVPGQDIHIVRVGGAVQSPGEFGFRAGMRVSDLIVFAGGFLISTNLENAEITRVTPTQEGPRTTRIPVNLRLAMAGDARENRRLEPNDFLLVRHIPEWDLYKMVKIAGEVTFPGTYTIKKGETLSSVLTRAGGFTSNAFPRGAFFTRVAVRQEQTKHLHQAIDRMEAQLLASSAAATEAALDPKEAQRAAAVLGQQRQLIAKLREILPLGRVVIRLDDPERLRGTPWDIELQEGDSLVVPQVQQTVNVLGSVVSPTAVIYDPHLSLNDYIRRAGGASKTADVKQTFVIKANGSAVSRQSFRWFGTGWTGSEESFHLGGMKSLRLDPGDSIIVPEDFERINWLREIKDIATIIGQVALTAGVIIAATK